MTGKYLSSPRGLTLVTKEGVPEGSADVILLVASLVDRQVRLDPGQDLSCAPDVRCCFACADAQALLKKTYGTQALCLIWKHVRGARLSSAAGRLVVACDSRRVRVLAVNAPGDYVLAPKVKPHIFCELMDPASMQAVIDPTAENNVCTCAGGLNRPRCQHKFSFEEVVFIRGNFLKHEDSERAMADQLMQYTVSTWRSKRMYFLNTKPVCVRSFRSAWARTGKTTSHVWCA